MACLATSCWRFPWPDDRAGWAGKARWRDGKAVLPLLPVQPVLPFLPMISASHLTRRFGTRVVVDDVSLTVGRGELVALLGPNGAGKTTTMRMLAGLIKPTRGSAAIDGVELTASN